MASLRFGALDPRHRGRLAEILAATAAFAREEIEVALDLFDETVVAGGVARGSQECSELSPLPLPTPPASYEFVGAFDDTGTLTGYACYGPTPGTDRTFDLYWIAVHPVAQRVGEGTRLLEEVERRLRTRGARLLVVETSSRDAYAPTRRFYAARGYREAARIGDFYAPADHRVIYTKRLTRAVASATGAHSPPPH